MMGFPIYNFTHPADQSKIKSSLLKKESPSPCPSPRQNLQDSPSFIVPASSSSSNSHTLALPSSCQSDPDERGPRQSFYIRLREKPLAKHDKAQYEHMHVVGHLKKTENVDDRNKSVGQHTFIGVMRPVRDRWANVPKVRRQNQIFYQLLSWHGNMWSILWPYCKVQQCAD